MRVNHRRPDILVPQEFLDGPNVIPVLEEMRGKGVAERVAGRRLGHPSPEDGLPYRPLDDRFVQVVPAPLAGVPGDVDAGSRKDPLPAQFVPRVWVFSAERRWKFDPACPPLQIPPVLRPDAV
jgi:hypothetical protein